MQTSKIGQSSCIPALPKSPHQWQKDFGTSSSDVDTCISEQMNHSLNMQKLTTTKRPTGLLTSHSREKTQMYMICKGTELAVWLMSPKLFWVAYLAIAPAKVAAPSSSWHGGSPAMESCLPIITSPELLHSHETLLTLGFKTVKARLDSAVERTAEWEQAAPAMGEREEVEVAGGGPGGCWHLFCLCPETAAQRGPFWGPNFLFGNPPTCCIHSNSEKRCSSVLCNRSQALKLPSEAACCPELTASTV